MTSFTSRVVDADNKHGIDEAFVKRILSGESLYKLSKEKQCSYAFLRLIKQGKIYKDLVNKCGGPALASDSATPKVESAKGSSETPERAVEHKEPTHHTQTIASGEHKSLKDIVTNPAELKALFEANGLHTLERWADGIARTEGPGGRRNYESKQAILSSKLLQIKPYKIHSETPEKIELSADALYGLEKSRLEKLGSSYYGDKISAEFNLEVTKTARSIKLKTTGKSKFVWLASHSSYKTRNEQDSEREVRKALDDNVRKNIEGWLEHNKHKVVEAVEKAAEKVRYNVSLVGTPEVSFGYISIGDNYARTSVFIKSLEFENLNTKEKATAKPYSRELGFHFDSNANITKVELDNYEKEFLAVLESELNSIKSLSNAREMDEIATQLISKYAPIFEKIANTHYEFFKVRLEKSSSHLSMHLKTEGSKYAGNIENYLSGKHRQILRYADFEISTFNRGNEIVVNISTFSKLTTNLSSETLSRIERHLDNDLRELESGLLAVDAAIAKNIAEQENRKNSGNSADDLIHNALTKHGFSAIVGHESFSGNKEVNELEGTIKYHLSAHKTLTSVGGARIVMSISAEYKSHKVGDNGYHKTLYKNERNIRCSEKTLDEALSKALKVIHDSLAERA